MFARLAARNVKRQIGNYLIYFITVSLTVAIMFAFNNVIFSPQLMEKAVAIQELNSGLIAITVLVSLIMAFVLGYATSFMLRLRKREFGMYLTLGMTRRNILTIFVLETVILGAVALAVGILLGLFLYQGLMMILVNLMEIEFAFASYSAQGLLLTIALVAGVFLLSSLTSALYLKKVSIYHLLHGDKVVEKGVRHPVLWFIVTLLALAAVVGSCIQFSQSLEGAMMGADTSGGGFLGSLAVLAVSIVLFHIALARSIVNLLLKNQAFRSRGTNTFTLRQLSGKLSANSIMAGALSFLIAFAIIGANCSFVQKISGQLSLDRSYPFDINVNLNVGRTSAIGPDEAETIIRRYAPIENTIPYSIYTTGNGYLHSFTRWTGDAYEGLYDSIMTQSDVNQIFAALGREPVELDDGFLILTNTPQAANIDFSAAALELNGKTYSHAGTVSNISMFAYCYFIAVVPDEAAEALNLDVQGMAYDLGDVPYDAAALRSDLSYQYTSGSGHTYQRCDYFLKEYGRIQMNSNSAVFVLSALYIAVVFVFMAMAILALKTLSGLTEDKQRYDILFRLGADSREQSRTLFRQTFSFFLLPFALPMLLSIPTGIICSQIMILGGFPQQTGQILITAAAVAAVMALIYLLYFTATYLLAKQTVVRAAHS